MRPSVHDHYRWIYFEAIDLVASAIKERFDQKGFKMLQELESILTKPNKLGSACKTTVTTKMNRLKYYMQVQHKNPQ